MIRHFIYSLFLLMCSCSICWPADRLSGEFGGIDIGRDIVGRSSFPTISEFRKIVSDPSIKTALAIKLLADEDNHSLPQWSNDGRRLALQNVNKRKQTSIISIFWQMSDAKPVLITKDDNAYDYMFRWGLNRHNSFVFSRLPQRGGATEFWGYLSRATSYISEEERRRAATNMKPQKFNVDGFAYSHPALYVRSDRVIRLVFENNKELMQAAAATDNYKFGKQKKITKGAVPRWSLNGHQLLALNLTKGRVGASELILIDLKKNNNESLVHDDSLLLRSPAWSPDNKYASCFFRRRGGNLKWSIQIAATDDSGIGRVISDDVVVNPDFTTAGPSWEPSGKRVWYFSKNNRRQAHYPFVATDVQSGKKVVVDYPDVITSPMDLTLNPVTKVPEVAFVGKQGGTDDVFVVFLNHY